MISGSTTVGKIVFILDRRLRLANLRNVLTCKRTKRVLPLTQKEQFYAESGHNPELLELLLITPFSRYAQLCNSDFYEPT